VTLPQTAYNGVMKRFATGAVFVSLALVLASSGCGGSARLHGTRAGNLDAGSIVEGDYPLKRGQSLTIGLGFVRNVGHEPILVESIDPQSMSPSLRATRGHIWLVPPNAHLSLPNAWPGWPPKNPPTKPGRSEPKSWVQPHPDYLSLPTRRAIPPGREAQLVYGIFLHSNPTAKTRVTALRITFKQGGHIYLWTLPESVHLCAGAALQC
jgi:hypothetical protein